MAATDSFSDWVAFWVQAVSLLLFGCGITDFFHTGYMDACWVWLVVVVGACWISLKLASRGRTDAVL